VCVGVCRKRSEGCDAALVIAACGLRLAHPHDKDVCTGSRLGLNSDEAVFLAHRREPPSRLAMTKMKMPLRQLHVVTCHFGCLSLYLRTDTQDSGANNGVLELLTAVRLTTYHADAPGLRHFSHTVERRHVLMAVLRVSCPSRRIRYTSMTLE
jgi:hypothetical protein